MEVVNRLVTVATNAANNNTVINVLLGGVFLALGARSTHNQKCIGDLRGEKESLMKSNKAMKNIMWEWRQQLFAEAETESVLIPLARLKAIYGEVSPPETENAGSGTARPAFKIVI